MAYPTKSEAENDKNKFYVLLREALSSKSIVQKDLASALGINVAGISRKLSSKSFSDLERKKIIEYLYVKRSILSSSARSDLLSINKDHLYYSIIDFFGIKDVSQDHAIEYLQGTYELWRYSVEHDDEFVHGRIDFFVEPNTGALHAEMTQPKKARAGARHSEEKFSGFIFRLADMYVLLLKDLSSLDMRITVFHRFRLEKIVNTATYNSVYEEGSKHIVHLDGFGLGIDGNNMFASPVYLVLVDDKERLENLNNILDVVEEENVPPRILKRLKRFPRIKQ